MGHALPHERARAVNAPARPTLHDPSDGLVAPAAAFVTARCTSVPARAGVVHSHAALTFVTAGQSRVECDGAWRVGAGDVLLVPAGAAHRTTASHNLAYWGVGLPLPSFEVAGDAALWAPFERVRDGAAAVVPIPTARQAWLVTLFQELEGLNQRAVHPLHDAARRSLATLIVAEVDAAVGGLAPSPPSRPSGGVAVAALRYIERNCLRPITLREVAAAVGRSPAHVTTALSRATGQSAVQWIVRGRMAEARRLLRAADARVDAIAERVGYADATHFIRMFRREHGVTPAAWRTAQQRRVSALSSMPARA